jgi:hypothetical protein
MPRRVLLGFVVLAACGGGDSASHDAAPDVIEARCDPAKPFGPPALVAELSSDADDGCARLYDDELGIVFCRRASGGNYDLWSAHRDSRDGAFDPPTLLTTANSVSNDLWPSVQPDGLVLVNDADRTTPNNYRMWASKRASTDDPFGPPALITELMPSDSHGFFANATSVYFDSPTRPGQGSNDIWRADYSALGTLGTPAPVLGDINTSEEEVVPVLTADERFIYFRRSTTTPNVDPMMPPDIQYDVWTASRSTPADGFGTSAKVPGLDLPSLVETPTWISDDDCVLWGQVNETGRATGLDIWRAERPL